MTVIIPAGVLHETAVWMIDLHDYWHSEIPLKLHTFEMGIGGTPQWHPDFASWLGIDYYSDRSDRNWEKNPEPRIRTTRAFRKLRKKAIREFELCYRVIILGEPIPAAMAWLNTRAQRNEIPLPEGKSIHYDLTDTVLLLVSGVEKLRSWW